MNDSIKVALIENESIAEILLKAINNSRKTINIAVYLCTLDGKLKPNNRSLIILKALCSAAERGVSVRMILGRPKNEYLERLNTITCNYMSNRGIHVRMANESSLHTKLLVVDGKFSSIGNHNFTERSFSKNREVSLAIWSDSIASTLIEIHTKYWANSNSKSDANSKNFIGEKNTPNNHSSTNQNSFHRVKNYQSKLSEHWQTYSELSFEMLFRMSTPPKNITIFENKEYFDGCVKIIQNAKKSIILSMGLIATTKWEQHPTAYLLDQLIVASKRDVNVMVITSKSNNKNQATIDKLKQNKINIHLLPESLPFHHKIMLIDGTLTIIGSHNWTAPSLKTLDDISLVIESEPMYERAMQAISNLPLQPTN